MLRKLILRIVKVAWLLPGFILWAAFPPMAEGTDVLFALAPLLYLARAVPSVRRVVRLMFLNGLVYWLASLAWMPAIVKNGGPWPLVVLGWAALAAYCALYFAAFGFLISRYWSWARPRGFGWRLAGVVVVEPLVWAGLELVRSRLFGGFAWNQLGVVAVNFGFGSPAALGGVYLLSALIVVVNGTFAGIAERLLAKVALKLGHWPVSPFVRRYGSAETLSAFAVILAAYAAAPEPPADPVGAEPLKVALVQRNLPCVFRPAEREEPFAVYSNLVASVSALSPELVVLAESAMCEAGPVDSERAAAFARAIARAAGASALIAGGSRRDSVGRLYNSAALYERLDEPGLRPPSGIYDKVHLVPFGEYIPGDKLFPCLQRLAPVGSCSAGELRLMDLHRRSGETVPFATAICYEDTDSALMRDGAARGARLFVFITNDAWFSDSEEALAHAWQATARAVETATPVVRVGASGVTGVISAAGRWDSLSGEDLKPLVDARGVMLGRLVLPAAACPTPYVRVGDWPLGIAFALLMVGMIMVKYRNHEKRRSMSV